MSTTTPNAPIPSSPAPGSPAPGAPMPEATASETPVSDAPALAVDAEVAVRDVSLKLEAASGRVLAVLGANGSGKSTLVGLLSGLVAPSTGTVQLEGQTVVDTASGTFVPPHRRDVGLLAQDPLLFPHLSVLENVAFGPRSRGASARESRDIAREYLRRVDALEFAKRHPAQLSGGQQQRVALARALAARPRMLLLDEPLAALDVDVAARMRRLLASTLRNGSGDISNGDTRNAADENSNGKGTDGSNGDSTSGNVGALNTTGALGTTVVLVTHDLLDVVALADDVAVLEGGRVVEFGPALEVLRRPRTSFLARLAGLVIVPGTLCTTERTKMTPALTVQPGPACVKAAGLTLTGRLHEPLPTGTPVVAAFRPASVSLYTPGTTPEGSPRNHMELEVTALEPLGGLVRVRGVLTTTGTTETAPESDAPSRAGATETSAAEASAINAGAVEMAADITPGASAELGLREGARVAATVKAAEVDIYARASSD